VKTEEAIEQQLESDEHCELVLVGSRTVDMTVSSGRLCLTNQRLLFVPRGFNVKGRSPWSVDRKQIAEIEVVERTWQPYNGGMRRRLLVRFLDGREQLFVVTHVDAVAADLRARLSVRPGDDFGQASSASPHPAG
jgi:hypothetical protein